MSASKENRDGAILRSGSGVRRALAVPYSGGGPGGGGGGAAAGRVAEVSALPDNVCATVERPCQKHVQTRATTPKPKVIRAPEKHQDLQRGDPSVNRRCDSCYFHISKQSCVEDNVQNDGEGSWSSADMVAHGVSVRIQIDHGWLCGTRVPHVLTIRWYRPSTRLQRWRPFRYRV